MKESTYWIQTWSGQAFDFENISSNSFNPYEYAKVLSRIQRFAGHCKWPYSVAQHCCVVSEQFTNNDERLAALLHDAHEIITGDITTPLKLWLGKEGTRLSILQNNIDSWLHDFHGLEKVDKQSIKIADLVVLSTEVRDLMNDPPRPWIKLPSPLENRIIPWDRDFAEDEWMSIYNKLV